MRDAAGLPLPLSHGPYAAEIVTVGACLRTLTRRRRGPGRRLRARRDVPERARRRADAVAQPGRRRAPTTSTAGTTSSRSASRPSTTPSTAWPTGSPGRSPSTRPTGCVLTYELQPQTGYPFALDLDGRLPARRRRPDHDAVGHQRRHRDRAVRRRPAPLPDRRPPGRRVRAHPARVDLVPDERARPRRPGASRSTARRTTSASRARSATSSSTTRTAAWPTARPRPWSIPTPVAASG